jgi:phosphopantetheinyl transferase
VITVYLKKSTHSDEVLNTCLLRHITPPIEILKTENGKPYIARNPVFFSLSHSGGVVIVAVNQSPVGVDFETLSGKKASSVLATFSPQEQAEITTERDFLAHWTARESYVKYHGSTLAALFRRLSYHDQTLYSDGTAVKEHIQTVDLPEGVLALCADEEEYQIVRL